MVAKLLEQQFFELGHTCCGRLANDCYPVGHTRWTRVDVVDGDTATHIVEQPGGGVDNQRSADYDEMSACEAMSAAVSNIGTASWKKTIWGRTLCPSMMVSGVVRSS